MAILIKQKSEILGYSNADSATAFATCEAATSNNLLVESCVDSLYGSKPFAAKYAKALKDGKTTDTYEVWFQKNKDKIQGFAEVGKGFLDSIFGGGSVEVDTPTVTVDTKKDNSGFIYLGIGVVVVAGIGIYAYKQMK